MPIVNVKEDIKKYFVEDDEDYYRFHYGFFINLAKKEYEENTKDQLIKKLNQIIIRQCNDAKKQALFITGV